MMKSFSGALIQLECLSFWWVERQGTGILRTIQPGSFGCFLDYILSQKSQPVNDTPDFKMSIDVFKFLLSLNGMFASLLFVYKVLKDFTHLSNCSHWHFLFRSFKQKQICRHVMQSGILC